MDIQMIINSGHVPKLHGRGLQSPGLTYEPRLRKAYGNHKKEWTIQFIIIIEYEEHISAVQRFIVFSVTKMKNASN